MMPFLFFLSLLYHSDVNHKLSGPQYHQQTEAKTKLILFRGHPLSHYRSSTYLVTIDATISQKKSNVVIGNIIFSLSFSSQYAL